MVVRTESWISNRHSQSKGCDITSSDVHSIYTWSREAKGEEKKQESPAQPCQWKCTDMQSSSFWRFVIDCLASPELPSPSTVFDKSLDKACFNSMHIHKELENFTTDIP